MITRVTYLQYNDSLEKQIVKTKDVDAELYLLRKGMLMFVDGPEQELIFMIPTALMLSCEAIYGTII